MYWISFFRGFELKEKVREKSNIASPFKRNKKRTVCTSIAVALFLCLLVVLNSTHAPSEDADRNTSTKCEVYPITTAQDICGVLRFTNTGRIKGATLYVYEKTQDRLLYEEELDLEAVRSGSYTVPTMSFHDDYVMHFEEYTGFGAKGDYLQEMRVKLSYETEKGDLKSRTFTGEPVEAYLCWIQQASKNHGSSLMKEGFITEVIHTPSEATRITDCFIEQPERVRRNDHLSVRVTMDGKPLAEKAVAEKINAGLFVVRIPVPEGVSQDGSHTLEIYVTQYVNGFRKSLEFLTTDTF